MQSRTAKRHCGHESCGCRVDPGAGDGRCCGAYCANAEREPPPEGACSCGHAECLEAQRVESKDEKQRTAMGPRGS